jgi:hypothetical protein
VSLKLVDGKGSRVPRAEELVHQFEVLRDIWYQLAEGLEHTSPEE